ncbi:hypothetical protein U1763_02385 [Sphingomonas sp. LB2R24]|uniref:hypothetical protein n=1 Tax=Sphingomonas sorbitolis TaxID=3096165 RepID=UPI002FCB09CE
MGYDTGETRLAIRIRVWLPDLGGLWNRHVPAWWMRSGDAGDRMPPDVAAV